MYGKFMGIKYANHWARRRTRIVYKEDIWLTYNIGLVTSNALVHALFN